MKLLTQAHQNAKTAKNSQFDGYLSAILHLAPFNLSGYNVCPAASNGCAMACLNTAGRGRFDNVQQARIRKTKMFFGQRQEFMALLIKDINALVKKATKENKKPVVRLNGTSDIDWENVEAIDGLNLFDMFPNVQFYDYTKRPDRVINNDYPNYHLTFSRSEVNDIVANRLLRMGYNVAIVYDRKPDFTIRTIKGEVFFVVDGDTHDFRFLDKENVIVALIAKGKAKKDTTGFVKSVA